MEKTRDPVSSKIWPDSTCAISVRRKGQILLVVESLVLSTTIIFYDFYAFPPLSLFAIEKTGTSSNFPNCKWIVVL